jgi:hypothetical protein
MISVTHIGGKNKLCYQNIREKSYNVVFCGAASEFPAIRNCIWPHPNRYRSVKSYLRNE